MLQRVKALYESVNLSGKIHALALDSKKLAAAQLNARIDLHRRKQARTTIAPPSNVVSALACSGLHVAHDGWTRVKADLCGMLGSGLQADRSFPPLLGWRKGPTYFRNAVGVRATLYPVGELIVGRGYTPAPAFTPMRNKNAVSAFLCRLTHHYEQAGTHGLMGAVLEQAPVAWAQHFEREQKMKAATACMCGAVVGRIALQVPRLALLATALVSQTSLILPLLYLGYAIEWALRLTKEGVIWAGDARDMDVSPVVEALSAFIMAVDSYSPIDISLEDPEELSGIEAGIEAIRLKTRVIPSAQAEWAEQYIARLFTDDCKRLGDIHGETFLNESAEREAVAEVAEEIAQSYRLLTSRLPSDEALRAGLQHIKRFVDEKWGADYFNPPELATSA